MPLFLFCSRPFTTKMFRSRSRRVRWKLRTKMRRLSSFIFHLSPGGFSKDEPEAVARTAMDLDKVSLEASQANQTGTDEALLGGTKEQATGPVSPPRRYPPSPKRERLARYPTPYPSSINSRTIERIEEWQKGLEGSDSDFEGSEEETQPTQRPGLRGIFQALSDEEDAKNSNSTDLKHKRSLSGVNDTSNGSPRSSGIDEPTEAKSGKEPEGMLALLLQDKTNLPDSGHKVQDWLDGTPDNSGMVKVDLSCSLGLPKKPPLSFSRECIASENSAPLSMPQPPVSQESDLKSSVSTNHTHSSLSAIQYVELTRQTRSENDVFQESSGSRYSQDTAPEEHASRGRTI